MDPDTDVCQTEQPQTNYSFDFTAEQSGAIQSPHLLGRERTCLDGVRESESMGGAKRFTWGGRGHFLVYAY